MTAYVLCAICGDPFEQLTESHLLTHGLTFRMYRDLFPHEPTIAESVREKLIKAATERNQRQSESHDDDDVECRICGIHLREVTWQHLKSAHGITLARYKELYPGVQYRAISVTAKKSASAKLANADPERRSSVSP